MAMRTESDVHGPHGSSAPACDHCGLPLHPEVRVCPFCEHTVSGALVALTAPKLSTARKRPKRTVGGIPERTLLVVGTCVLASIAVIAVALSALV
jgi:hypothetical protein